MKHDDDSRREDVASLFRKFGGDVRDYKEFAPSAAPVLPERAAAVATTVPPMASAQATVPVAGSDAATEAEAASASTIDGAAAVLVPDAAAPSRALDALFLRLAGAAPAATPAHGLMARWRRPA